jgi:hypothetical protein
VRSRVTHLGCGSIGNVRCDKNGFEYEEGDFEYMASRLQDAVRICFFLPVSPDQSAKYFKWYAQNADRVMQTPPAAFVKKEPIETKESSLSDLCKRLHDVLRIPDNGKDFSNCEELGKPELDVE